MKTIEQIGDVARHYLQQKLGDRRGLDYREIVQDEEIEKEIEDELIEILDDLHREGMKDALRYAIELVEGRRILNRLPAYLAAVDEMDIFLKAAMERVENGETIHSTATVQNDISKSNENTRRT